MPGRFITLEGIDGCGKTTVARAVVSALGKSGLKTILTTEPSENWLGDAVRRGYTEDIDPLSDAFLFMADRATHVSWMRKKLDEGFVVISDRYADSTVAYQGASLDARLKAAKLDAFDWLKDMNDRLFPRPDLTILLDVDPEVSLGRLGGRDSLTKFEKKEYLKRVRANYLMIAERENRLVVVDASRPEDVVLSDVLGIFKSKVRI
ncbi:MAG: dTMP kinase [Candidatus Dadabacteria bacterium]|nr:dTMP kinase [Candidatus Dadabacteria bacterium]